MRIVVVNWQDRENPQAGGAELHLHEIFGRLARGGHSVTLLCGGWRGAPAQLELDGMQVHRVGTRYTFPLHARRYFRSRIEPSGFDLLVEDINKIPLFTPRWTNRPVVALVPHLFGGAAFAELPAPVAAAVWLAERPLPRVYRGVPFQAISRSTAEDLTARGIPHRLIRVIYPGVDTVFFSPAAERRSGVPGFAYLGRLKRYKGVDTIIRAFARVRHPDAVLHIAGSGSHAGALQRLARSLDLGDRVRFLGFITEEQKLELLRSVWGVALASPKEGWGITNLEAAACGTPVVASDSPGIRESVRHEETGFLVPHGNVEAFARAMERLALSRELVERLGLAARRFAEGFTWERAARETEADLTAALSALGGS